MQRFKNNMSDGWLFRQELRLFRNFMRNWKREVDDCDFFDIFANGNNTTENEAKAFLKKYFSLETLAKCDSVSVERVRDKADDEGRIVDFSLGRCSTDGPRMVPLLLARGSNKVAADILGLLKDGPKSPSELREALGLSSANYLTVRCLMPLARAGFIGAVGAESCHSPQRKYRLLPNGRTAVG